MINEQVIVLICFIVGFGAALLLLWGKLRRLTAEIEQINITLMRYDCQAVSRQKRNAEQAQLLRKHEVELIEVENDVIKLREQLGLFTGGGSCAETESDSSGDSTQTGLF